MRVDVLGPLRIEVGGSPADAGGPRQRAVLARLAAAGGHVVPTDRFIDDLWQGEPPPKALAALQVYVSNLRRALEPGRAPRTPATVVVSMAPGYALRLPDEQVDAWRFESLLRRGSELSESDPREADRLLRAALDAWAGPAYAEFADESWATPEAARLEELRLACVEAAGRVALRLGRAALVVPELDRHVQEHPLREEAVHVLATALYRAGRQAEALAVLRQARDRLADELGVDPGPALRALEADVLAHAEHLSADTPPPTSIPAAGQRPVVTIDAEREPSGTRSDAGGRHNTIAVHGQTPDSPQGAEAVGRDAELAALGAAAEAVQRDGLRIMWVGGEAGAGKSTLVRTFSATMAERGWQVAWGRCPEVDGAPPAWAWTEVLAGWESDAQAATGEERRSPHPRSGAAQSGLSPDLGESTAADPFRPASRPGGQERAGRLPATPTHGDGTQSHRSPSPHGNSPADALRSTSPSDGYPGAGRFPGATTPGVRAAADQFQLAQAVGERLGTGGALLVVLDDVHRADGETLQVLRHVAVALAGRSVLIVATFRTGEDHPQLGAARAALAGPRSMELLLGGLGADAAARVLAGHLGAPVDAEVAAVVHERTGGNPLFLAETARLISAEGAGSAVRAIPAGIGHILRRRLARLPAAAQTVLRHASILGRDVDIDVLAEAFTEDEDAVLDGLEAGVLAGLLEEPAPGRVRFGHALLRDVLYDDMPQLRRRRLHERVLNVLERTNPGDVAALGHHALAAATPASAVRAARHGSAAARQAAAYFAHREAAQLYAAALDALGLQRPGSGDQGADTASLRLDLLCGLTSARANSGDAIGARTVRWDAVLAAAAVTGVEPRGGAGLTGGVGDGGATAGAGLGRATAPGAGLGGAGHPGAGLGGTGQPGAGLGGTGQPGAGLGGASVPGAGLGRAGDQGAARGGAGDLATGRGGAGDLGVGRGGVRDPGAGRGGAGDPGAGRGGGLRRGRAGSEAVFPADGPAAAEAAAQRWNSVGDPGQDAPSSADLGEWESFVRALAAVANVEPLARALAAFDAPVAWSIRVARAIDRPLVELLERTLARGDLPAGLRARMLVTLVYELEGDEVERCDEASAEALRIARSEGDALVLCQALNARYFAVLNPQRRHELPAVGAELLAVAERAGLLGFQAQAHHVLYQAALERNDLRLAQEHLDRALEKSTAGQLGVTLSVMAILGAIRAVFAGDHATAERIYTELGERIEAAGQPNAYLVSIIGVFFVRLTQGLGHTYLPVLEPLRTLSTAESEAGEFIARAYVDAGRLDEARAVWRPDTPVREDYYWLAMMGLRGENAAALGDVAVAAECYAQLLPWAGQFVGLASGTVPGPPVDLVLGKLAVALGRPADAHFEAAKELAARTGATPWM
ncbi:BTAD domain-containing putative transcriptional regulator [Dactylosporangium sp. CA-052675]|uniref:BTAD domain-containing putative transcriptional regulator n=1 Tax=Dactylosporangium sp. CA-052675 TaxID=3239927 RepID=UPI003D8FFD6B